MMMLKTMALVLAAAAAAAAPKWTAILRPVGDKGPKGSATAEASAAGTRVTLEISGARPNGELPWHIHGGDCRAQGRIWGEAASYPPLRTGASGSASGATTLPSALPPGEDFAVTVHKSAEDMTPVACGALLQVPMPDTTRPMKP